MTKKVPGRRTDEEVNPASVKSGTKGGGGEKRYSFFSHKTSPWIPNRRGEKDGCWEMQQHEEGGRSLAWTVARRPIRLGDEAAGRHLSKTAFDGKGFPGKRRVGFVEFGQEGGQWGTQGRKSHGGDRKNIMVGSTQSKLVVAQKRSTLWTKGKMVNLASWGGSLQPAN